jgi:hypothetical protein
MQLRCTRSSSFPYEGIYASCCHWRSRADVLALTTRSLRPEGRVRNGQIECIPRHQPILLSSPPRCPQTLGRYYVILLFDVVLNWSWDCLHWRCKMRNFLTATAFLWPLLTNAFALPPLPSAESSDQAGHISSVFGSTSLS